MLAAHQDVHEEGLAERQPLVGSGGPKLAGIAGNDSPSMDIDIEELGRCYGVRRFHVLLLMVSFFLAQPGVSAQGTAPYLLQDIREEFEVSSAKASLVATAVLGGSTVGVFLCGLCADAIGRRTGLALFAVVINLAAVLHLAIPHQSGTSGFIQLIAVRALIGIPYGGFLTTVTPYVIEFFADSIRGFAQGFPEVSWSFGAIYCITVVQTFGNAHNWRKIFAFAPALPTFIMLLSLACLPESPRWLLTSSRNNEKAKRALEQVLSSPGIWDGVFVGRVARIDRPEGAVTPSDRALGHSWWTTLRFLWNPEVRWTTMVCSILYTIIAGVANTMWIWGPAIGKHVLGRPVDMAVFKISEWGGVAGLAVFVLLSDAVGRKPLLMCGYAVLTLVLLGCQVTLSESAFTVLWTTGQFGSSLVWPVMPLVIAEEFPTAARGSALGVCMVGGRIVSVLFPMVAGHLLDRGQFDLLMPIFALLTIIALLLSARYIQDRANCRLEDVCSKKSAGIQLHLER